MMKIQKTKHLQSRRGGALSSWALIAMMAVSASAQGTGSPRDMRKQGRKGPDPRPNLNAEAPEGTIKMGSRSISFPTEFRSIDGTENNEENPTWGATETPFIRLAEPDYADGFHEPSGEDRPSARVISNAVCAQSGEVYNRLGVSDFVWQWGQFLDHDITETPTADPEQPFDIPVPAGDPYFDPTGTGAVVISMNRSFAEQHGSHMEQVNEITAYIDASNVYGSDSVRAAELRANDGTGKLKVSEGDLMPFNTAGLPNAPSIASTFFLGGDFRANEQVGLIAMHTLFMREHNYWADVVAQSNPDTELSGDTIYELARAIVAAEMQIITYREFLPLVIGRRGMPRYEGYDPEVDATISNEFATASYRFGHTMLSSQLLMLDEDGDEAESGHLSLAGAFFNPDFVIDNGIDNVLRGLATQQAQEVDTLIIDDVRNFLFGPPGAGGFDLASLNMQRGRDHGLPGFNGLREAVGLSELNAFRNLGASDEIEDALEETYDSVDDIDPWLGCLAEEPERGQLLGETASRVLRDQFIRLRDGDRFWYQHYLDEDLQKLLEKQTLAIIIKRNTDIGRELQRNVFLAGSKGAHPSKKGESRRNRGAQGGDRRSR